MAVIGTAPDASAPEAALWITHIWVDDAGDAARKVSAAGGSVLAEPFDAPGGAAWPWRRTRRGPCSRSSSRASWAAPRS